MEETQKPRTSPRDVFLYLLEIITLYWGTISLFIVLFQLINVAFPDVLNPYYDAGSAMRFPLAALIIIFPVYLLVTIFLNKDLKRNPEKSELRTRKWLLYLTLFLTALLIIGDLVALIYNFLNGDLTTPFLLKVLSILVVAAAIFGYYLYDIRRKPQEFSGRMKILVYAVSVFVVAAVVGGIWVSGSPFRQRLAKYDDQKVNDLQAIQYQVIDYWQRKEKLPDNLQELNDNISFVVPKDPQYQRQYGYEVTGDLSFKLCAEFNLASSKTNQMGYYAPSWNHGQGEQCFEKKIDPSMYKTPVPPVPKPL